MAIYRELFFNNLVDLLGGAFPVARRILGTDRWRRLVRDFYAGHHAHTPYFLELPREFTDWLRARETRAEDEPEFLDELAHYEWVELALSISEEVPPAAVTPGRSPLDQPLAVSPLAWPLAYRWPVHRLSPEYQPEEPPVLPTFLVVYRDAADTVQFLAIGAETARLLDVLELAPGLTGSALLAGQPVAPDATAEQALVDLLRRGVLVVAAPARSDGS